MRGTRAERRAHWQDWKGAYRRDWSTSLYFETWIKECHPVGYALLLGSGILAIVCAVLVFAVIPFAALALLGAPSGVVVGVEIVWLCFGLGAMVARWGP